MTKSELALENAALRAELSQVKNDLVNEKAHVTRLRLIIGKRYSANTRGVDLTGVLTFKQAAEIAQREHRTVQDVLRIGR